MKLQQYLEQKGCFKLVCGAGNEDIKEVEKLVALYSAAGCKIFDLSANLDIINAAKKGLTFSGIKDAYLCVSVGIKGDPHVKKAQIDCEKCITCAQCEEICPQKAIKYCKVKRLKCIGCGKCEKICPKKAITLYSENINLSEILPPIIDKGIDCIELHAMGEDESEVFEKWDYIKQIFEGVLSICISRGKLSDEKMIERIAKMITGANSSFSDFTIDSKDSSHSIIIQADGFPMSGGEDDYKTTLQAVATAEMVQNANLPVFLMLSGGTNSKTGELAKQCKINYHGIAIGSYARKIVRKYIERKDFLTDKNVFNSALMIAKTLVSSI